MFQVESGVTNLVSGIVFESQLVVSNVGGIYRSSFRRMSTSGKLRNGIGGTLLRRDDRRGATRGLVEGMIQNASDDGLLQFNEDLKPGEQIRLIGGPLNGHLGVFVGASEGDRVSILMTMLAREVSARVPRAQVMRV